MSKIDYTHAEFLLDSTLYNHFLKNLYELSAIATQAQEGNEPLDTEHVDKILKEFRAEVKKLKLNHPDKLAGIGLAEEEFKRLMSPSKDFKREDWLKILELNDQIRKLNKEQAKRLKNPLEDDERIEKERKEHVNKRFNVKKGWLPLH